MTSETKTWTPMKQDDSLKRAVIFDLDGSLALRHPDRDIYDASSCDKDLPHEHVIELLKLYFKAGHKVFLLTGRYEEYRKPTEIFCQKYFPEVEYELFMRKDKDFRKDVVVKELIFNEHIKGKFFVSAWIEDRLQVARWVYENGLPLFRVNNPESTY